MPDTLKVSWGGVWGGVLVAVGLLLLLTALGLAIGVSAAEPGQTEGAILGMAAGVWAGLSLLLALCMAGWVSTRIGATTDRTTGFFEGVLVWVVTVLLMVYLASSGIGMLANGAFSLVGGASQAIGSAVRGGQAAAKAQEGMVALKEKAESDALEQKAQELQPAARTGAWMTFGALLLSLLAAIMGAMLGRREPDTLRTRYGDRRTASSAHYNGLERRAAA